MESYQSVFTYTIIGRVDRVLELYTFYTRWQHSCKLQRISSESMKDTSLLDPLRWRHAFTSGNNSRVPGGGGGLFLVADKVVVGWKVDGMLPGPCQLKKNPFGYFLRQGMSKSLQSASLWIKWRSDFSHSQKMCTVMCMKCI